MDIFKVRVNRIFWANVDLVHIFTFYPKLKKKDNNI